MTQSRRSERIGLLGGSFDPIHVGHIALARAAQIALPLDSIRFVPTARSWQKRQRQTDPAHRQAMIARAIAGQTTWHIDDREVRRGGASYTVDTLAGLREELDPAIALVLILGGDQLRNLATWHRWRELLHYCHIAATQRGQSSLQDLPDDVESLMQAHGRDALPDTPAGSIVLFRMPAVPVSSTRLRQAIDTGEPVAELLPPGVAEYIAQHHLYREEA